MNIEFDKKEKVNFSKLESGSVFSYCSNIYMKLDVVYYGRHKEFNAIDLIKNSLVNFDGGIVVTKENYSFKIL